MASGKKEFFFVDNVKYDWDGPSTITGAQVREKASVPANVELYEKIPGKPDRLVEHDTQVSLAGNAPVHFSTQAAGSTAG
jgi:hypothetical protein